MPLISDDLNYRLPYRDCFLDGKPLHFNMIAGHIRELYLCNSPRLANILMIGLQFLPRWICGMLSGVACYLTLVTGIRLLGLTARPYAAMFLSALFVFFMPWVDQIYVFDFQLNYLWSGAVLLLYLHLLLQSESIWLYAVALILGFMNESCGFPAWVATIALITCYRRYRQSRTFISLLLLTVGLAFLYLAPGMQSYRNSGWHPFAHRQSVVIVFCLPELAYILSVLVVCLRRRKFRLRPVDCMFVAVAFAGMSVMLFSRMGPRVGWASVLVALCGLCGLTYGRISKYRLFISLLFVAALAHLALVDTIAWKEKKVYDEVLARYKANPDEQIFADFTLREYAPLFAFQKPYYNIFAHYGNIRLFSEFWHSEDEKVKVLPIELKDFAPERADVLSDGFLVFRGMIVGPCVSSRPVVVRAQVDGRTHKDFMVMPFVDSRGVKRSWWHSNHSSLDDVVHPIPDSITYDK